MPWESRLDEVRGLIYTRVTGALTKPGAIDHRDALAAHPAFDATFAHVLDLRAVDDVDLTTSEIEALADASVFRAPARQVIIAPDDLTFGPSRIYYAFRSCRPFHEEIAVCRTVADACRRLGIDDLPPISFFE